MTELSPERLDEMAVQVVAGIAEEAADLAAQPFFAGLMEQVEKKPAKLRRYTAAEFFLRDPDRFRMVVMYLAEGHGQLWTADRVGCSIHTVREVVTRFPRAVAIAKERLAEKFEQAATVLVELTLDNPESVPPAQRMIAAGIAADKSLLLRGGPTVITEKRHVFTHDDYAALIDGAIEVDTGVSGGKSGPKGAPAGPVTADHPPQSGSDVPSLALQRDDQTATPVATQDSPDLALSGGGGGRGPAALAPPSSGTP